MKYLKSLEDASIVILLATIYSMIEIELEAGCGWTAGIPTSQIVKSHHFTYYHLFMILFLSIMCISIWWKRYDVHWTKKILVAGYFLCWILLLEDFLWFVLSPYFTLSKYKKENIPWHKSWVGPIPTHNLIGFGILLFLGYMVSSSQIWATFPIILVATFLIVLAAPMYHKFYKSTHNFDPSKPCAKIPGLYD